MHVLARGQLARGRAGRGGFCGHDRLGGHGTGLGGRGRGGLCLGRVLGGRGFVGDGFGDLFGGFGRGVFDDILGGVFVGVFGNGLGFGLRGGRHGLFGSHFFSHIFCHVGLVQRGAVLTQHDAGVVLAGFDPAGGGAAGQTGQKLGVGGRRFGPEETVIRSQVAEIFGDRLHRGESVIEPFESARKRAIGHGKNFVRLSHGFSRLLSLPVWGDMTFPTSVGPDDASQQVRI